MTIAFTVTPGTYTDQGVRIPVSGGPWRCGPAPTVRVAAVRVFSVQAVKKY